MDGEEAFGVAWMAVAAGFGVQGLDEEDRDIGPDAWARCCWESGVGGRLFASANTMGVLPARLSPRCR